LEIALAHLRANQAHLRHTHLAVLHQRRPRFPGCCARVCVSPRFRLG
jgi:hypothetical protein